MQSHRLHRLVSLVLLVCLAAPNTGRSETVDPKRAAQVAAGFVLNFLRYTEWPADAFVADASPIVVCVAGDELLAVSLEALIAGVRIGPKERAIQVRRLQFPEPSGGEPQQQLVGLLQTSHLVFLGRREQHRRDWVLQQVATKPVMTVSDAPGFADRGGMLALVVRNGRMGFDANTKRLEERHINLSSKVLRLARIVETGGR